MTKPASYAVNRETGEVMKKDAAGQWAKIQSARNPAGDIIINEGQGWGPVPTGDGVPRLPKKAGGIIPLPQELRQNWENTERGRRGLVEDSWSSYLAKQTFDEARRGIIPEGLDTAEADALGRQRAEQNNYQFHPQTPEAKMEPAELYRAIQLRTGMKDINGQEANPDAGPFHKKLSPAGTLVTGANQAMANVPVLGSAVTGPADLMFGDYIDGGSKQQMNQVVKQSLEDRPNLTRLGQSLPYIYPGALLANAGSKAISGAIANSPRASTLLGHLTPKGTSMLARGTRYGGRLATLAPGAAADSALFGAKVEGDNQELLQDRNLSWEERLGLGKKYGAIGGAAGPLGSIAYRAGRAPVTKFFGGTGRSTPTPIAHNVEANLGAHPGGKIDAPTTQELDDMTRIAYAEADAAGVRYSPDGYMQLVSSMEQALKNANMDKSLHPRASRMMELLAERIGDSPTLSQLDNLRKLISKNVGQTAERAEQRLGSIMIKEIDNFIQTSASAIAPRGQDAAKLITKARELHARKMKAWLIDEAIDKATTRAASTASGGNIENTLRQEFRKILHNRKLIQGFSKSEREAIREFVMGSTGQNILRQIGKMSPQGNGLMQLLGISGVAQGVTGGLAGWGLAGAVGTGYFAKKAAVSNIKAGADRIGALVRRGEPGPAASRAPTVLQQRIQKIADSGAVDAPIAIGAGAGALGAGDTEAERGLGALVGGAAGYVLSNRLKARGGAPGGGGGVKANGFGAAARKREAELGTQTYNNPKLTPAENKYAEMRINGMSNKEIAEEMEVSGAAISQAFKRMQLKGVTIPKGAETRGRPQIADHARVREMMSQGLSHQQIMQRTGLSSEQLTNLKANMARRNGMSFDTASDIAAFGGGAATGYLNTPEFQGEQHAQLNGLVSGIGGLMLKRGGVGIARGGLEQLRKLPDPLHRPPPRTANINDVTAPGRGSLGDDMFRLTPDGEIAQWPSQNASLMERLRSSYPDPQTGRVSGIAPPKGEDFGLPNIPGARYQVRGPQEFIAMANTYERMGRAVQAGDRAAVAREVRDLMPQGTPDAQIAGLADEIAAAGVSQPAMTQQATSAPAMAAGKWKRNPQVMEAYKRAGEPSMGYSVPPPEAFNLPVIPFARGRAMSPQEFERMANTYERIQMAAINGDKASVERLLAGMSLEDIPPQVMADTVGKIMKRFGN